MRLMESHLINSLVYKEYVVDIKEEIIEYDITNNRILSYVVIVE
jgi:hypothetical protein